jgi:hypothetical protein
MAKDIAVFGFGKGYHSITLQQKNIYDNIDINSYADLIFS